MNNQAFSLKKKTMKKYMRMSSAAVMTGGLRVKPFVNLAFLLHIRKKKCKLIFVLYKQHNRLCIYKMVNNKFEASFKI